MVRRIMTLGVGVVLGLAAIACQGNVFALKVGDCFNGTSTGTVSNVSVVACTAAHDAEVFDVFDYPAPPTGYPGDTAISQVVADRCGPDFATFDGVDITQSSLTVGQLVPSTDSWGSGDRQIICFVKSSTPGHQLTGSAKGTRQ